MASKCSEPCRFLSRKLALPIPEPQVSLFDSHPENFQMNRRAFFRRLAASPLLPVLWRRSATSTQAAMANSSARRVRPSDPSWPTAESWEKLKQQVGGHLIQVQSPLVACATLNWGSVRVVRKGPPGVFSNDFE